MLARTSLPLLILAASLGAGCLDDDRPARWSVVSDAVLQPSCGTAGCHSALAATADIVLDSRDAGYRALVTGSPGVAGAWVQPGDDQSALLFLLRADEVRRMPPDAPLPPADIQLVEDWIVAGAEQD